MLEELREQVFQANLMLPKHSLVTFTWGNVSGIDRDKGLIVIKPSGIAYEKLRADDMVVVELESGKALDNRLNPSSDTTTHLEIYKAFKVLRMPITSMVRFLAPESSLLKRSKVIMSEKQGT